MSWFGMPGYLAQITSAAEQAAVMQWLCESCVTELDSVWSRALACFSGVCFHTKTFRCSVQTARRPARCYWAGRILPPTARGSCSTDRRRALRSTRAGLCRTDSVSCCKTWLSSSPVNIHRFCLLASARRRQLAERRAQYVLTRFLFWHAKLTASCRVLQTVPLLR
jgi:hypothetical protein